MAKYVIQYKRTNTEIFQEHLEVESLAAAYLHAKEKFADLDTNEQDDLQWEVDYDLTSLPVCSEIIDPLGVHHIYAELPADLAVVARPQDDTIDDNTWDGVVDQIEELGQKDKDLFGPVL